MPLVLPIDRTWDGAPAAPTERATVALAIEGGDLRIEVDAPLHGDPPPDAPPGPTWALWEHEVVELFVLGEGERYTEIEVGPHGHHLVLQLDGVRRPVASGLPLELVCRIDGARWTATARLARALLPPGPRRCNAYRIAGPAGARRHEAMVAVPGEAADFHRLDRFAPWPL